MPKRPPSPEIEPEDDSSVSPLPLLKPLPSFNGALSKFAFKPSTPSFSSTTSSPPTRSLRSSSKPTTPTKPATPRSSAKATSSSSTSSSVSVSTSSPKPKKRTKKSSSYAPPSAYSSLSPIPDCLSPNLLLIFLGLNPGLLTSQLGHAYASPTNSFWKLLHHSGLTPDRQLSPSEDLSLPELYSFGRTDLVRRPTRNQGELSMAEMVAGVEELERKVRRWRPECVAVMGKGVWEAVWKGKMGTKLDGKTFKWGWQEMRLGEIGKGDKEEEGGVKEEEWPGARVFVAVSTSGLVAGYSWEMKLGLMKELAGWVERRRRERGETAPRGLPEEVVRGKVQERMREWEGERERVKGGYMEGVAKGEDGGEGVKVEKMRDEVKIEGDEVKMERDE